MKSYIKIFINIFSLISLLLTSCTKEECNNNLDDADCDIKNGEKLYTIVNKTDLDTYIKSVYHYGIYCDTLKKNDSISYCHSIYGLPFSQCSQVLVLFEDSTQLKISSELKRYNIKQENSYDTTFFCDTLVKMRFVIDEDFYNFAKSQNK